MVKSTGNIPPHRFASAAVARLDRQLAVVIAAVAVGLLARDIPWDLLPGDSGEFQFAAWRLGLAHPTGYPLYLLLGGGWQHLLALFGMAPSGALNLLSALFAGIAAGLFYWLLVQWLPGPASTRRLGAGLAVAFLLANPTVRSQAIIAEVYALHLLLLVAILLAAHSLLAAGHAGEAAVVRPQRRSPRHLVVLCLLVGLALTHHATTLLLLPPLLLYLWLSDRTWWRPARAWLWAAPALVLPSLLYLYIPLRSGPDASPWLHQRLGDGVLSLYANTLPAFVDFVTGRSISVGFYAGAEAWAGAPIALLLWLRHFEWAGLVLMGVGIFVLVRQRQWPLLALTVGVVGVQQLFNLFYAIGDIFVYYIPCYVMACIWIGFAAAGIGVGFRRELLQADAAPPPASPIAPALRWARVLVVLLYWLPVQLWLQYTPLIQQARAESVAVRGAWETILAAQPPAEAILISNDRNEIVPLFYLQQVEGRAQGYTGLFPRMAPDARFADIGSTIATALASRSGSASPADQADARAGGALRAGAAHDAAGGGARACRHPGACCSRRPALRPPAPARL